MEATLICLQNANWEQASLSQVYKMTKVFRIKQFVKKTPKTYFLKNILFGKQNRVLADVSDETDLQAGGGQTDGHEGSADRSVGGASAVGRLH